MLWNVQICHGPEKIILSSKGSCQNSILILLYKIGACPEQTPDALMQNPGPGAIVFTYQFKIFSFFFFNSVYLKIHCYVDKKLSALNKHLMEAMGGSSLLLILTCQPPLRKQRIKRRILPRHKQNKKK
jgi:hypothetical protein